MPKRIALVIASALVALVLPLASSAQAATYPQFGKVQYDSPGSDTGSNTSLNAEYITIKNTSSSRLSLTGYTVHDAAGHSYTFGTFHLSAGKTVYLHTGTGTDTWQHRYWGQDWYVEQQRRHRPPAQRPRHSPRCLHLPRRRARLQDLLTHQTAGAVTRRTPTFAVLANR
jgi:Lamin Tail Domain